tara:strand:+ start:4317 stop:5315 length:999 start_codon:yes stop_codon:yes gene_type:complete
MKKIYKEDRKEIDLKYIKDFLLNRKIYFIISTTFSIFLGIITSYNIKNLWIGNIELIFEQKRITKDKVKSQAEENLNINESIFNKKKIFEEAYIAYEIMNSNKFKYDLHFNEKDLHFKKTNNTYNNFTQFKRDFKVSQIKQNTIRLTYRNKERNLISSNLNNALILYKEIYKNNYEKQETNLQNKYSQKIQGYESKIIASLNKLNNHLSNKDFNEIRLYIMQNLLEKKGSTESIQFINNLDKLSSEKKETIFLELKRLKIKNKVLEQLLYEYQIFILEKNANKDPWILIKEPIIFKENNRNKRLSYFLFSFLLINILFIFGLKIKDKISNKT